MLLIEVGTAGLPIPLRLCAIAVNSSLRGKPKSLFYFSGMGNFKVKSQQIV